MLLVPYPSYKLSARCMHDYHLALSLRIAKKIYRGLIYPQCYSTDMAVVMWKDTPSELLLYADYMRKELEQRKLPDPRDHTWMIQELAFRGRSAAPPWWLGSEDVHGYHRQHMMKYDQVFYSAMFLRLKTVLLPVHEPDYLKVTVDPKIAAQLHWINNHER